MENKLEKKIVLQKLKKNLAYVMDLDEKKITQTTEFRGELGMDSLNRYEFGYAVEGEFDITIPDEKMQELDSINDYITYIEENHS